jgi:hypothetical protein
MTNTAVLPVLLTVTVEGGAVGTFGSLSPPTPGVDGTFFLQTGSANPLGAVTTIGLEVAN